MVNAPDRRANKRSCQTVSRLKCGVQLLCAPVLFPTFTFGVFFAVVLPVSWALRSRPLAWKLFVLGASYWFYAAWDRRFVMLLASMTLVNAAMAQASRKASRAGLRRAALITALTFDLAVLGFFKYYGFFVDSMESHLGLSSPALSIILPVGISFYTFQAISYVVDVHRRDTEVAGLLDFAVYLSFFPQLVAGPIVRATEFLPQMRFSPRKPTRKHERGSTGGSASEQPEEVKVGTDGSGDEHPAHAEDRIDGSSGGGSQPAANGLQESPGVNLGQAAHLIGRGMFKKVVIADYLANAIVKDAFASPDSYSALDVLLGVYGYAVQIYADFSGYTDMAIGVALLMGFRFPQNFDRPYTAISVQDFWRRWHMTLSRWLRDYLYIPLGGNRRGKARTYLNLLVTMTLGGLWHGAAGVFIAWGLYQGLGLALERLSGELNAKRTPQAKSKTAESRSDVSESEAHESRSEVSERLVSEASESERSRQSSLAGSIVRRMWPALRTATRAARPAVKMCLRVIVVFHFVCAGWVLFNSDSLASAADVFLRIARGWGDGSQLMNPMVLAVIVASLLAQFTPSRWTELWTERLSKAPAFVIACGFAAWTTAVVAFGPEGVADYIYFQF